MRKLVPVLIIWVTITTIIVDCPRTATPGTASADLIMTNVYDAFGPENAGLTYDFGFSAVVQYKGKTILFDAGTTAEIFQRNLKAKEKYSSRAVHTAR